MPEFQLVDRTEAEGGGETTSVRPSNGTDEEYEFEVAGKVRFLLGTCPNCGEENVNARHYPYKHNVALEKHFKNIRKAPAVQGIRYMTCVICDAVVVGPHKAADHLHSDHRRQVHWNTKRRRRMSLKRTSARTTRPRVAGTEIESADDIPEFEDASSAAGFSEDQFSEVEGALGQDEMHDMISSVVEIREMFEAISSDTFAAISVFSSLQESLPGVLKFISNIGQAISRVWEYNFYLEEQIKDLQERLAETRNESDARHLIIFRMIAAYKTGRSPEGVYNSYRGPEAEELPE